MERCKLEDMPRQARLDDRQGPVVKGRKILCQIAWRCESWDTQGRPIISVCPNVMFPPALECFHYPRFQARSRGNQREIPGM